MSIRVDRPRGFEVYIFWVAHRMWKVQEMTRVRKLTLEALACFFGYIYACGGSNTAANSLMEMSHDDSIEISGTVALNDVVLVWYIADETYQ